MDDPQEIESFLVHLCDLAAAETLPRFRSANRISNKLDEGFDPVTEADRGAERAIRKCIEERFPDHAIIGEEYGLKANEGSRYKWIIDPVDGTRAFISGLPLWGTLIALYRDNSPLAGVMSQPFTGETFLSNSQESFLQRREKQSKLATSEIHDLASATLMTTSPYLFDASKFEAYHRVEEKCRMARYGADCYAYCLLASGNIDIVIESGLQVYDIAALIPIIREAGGIISDWEGNPEPWGGNVIASANPRLHNEALRMLSG